MAIEKKLSFILIIDVMSNVKMLYSNFVKISSDITFYFFTKYNETTNRYTFFSKLFILICIINFAEIPAKAQEKAHAIKQDTHIIDFWHYSQIFGENRNYRVFFPPEYFQEPEKRYPVIYFFHGWSQRYFGPVGDDYSNYDLGQDNGGDNIANFVTENDVIIVKIDGYKSNDLINYDLSPYNIGGVETYRQFPIYFPEFVEHFDASYRTIPDRLHRAVSGLSMGGFMTFWISGKYPHLISAAGNFCGSPEFFVGPSKFPVEYRNMDMYNNYGGVNVRMHYGDKDNLRYYHQDMNRIWTQVMDNYTYKIFDARHTTCGLGEMFDFIMETFENPPEIPDKWGHIDVYPEFTIWDYHIRSDRFRPGFTILEDVNERGFKCSVREFLPDGSLLPFVDVSLTTPSIYEKNQPYVINDLDLRTNIFKMDTVHSDGEGKLTVNIDGSAHHIGISQLKDLPNICLASFHFTNMGLALNKSRVNIAVKLTNKGFADANNLTVKLSPTKTYVQVINSISNVPNLPVGEIRELSDPFIFYVDSNNIEIAKFKLTITDKENNEWSEFLEIPLFDEKDKIENYVIADGKEFTVSRSGIDSVTLMLGKGNGDGKVNPGETIEILIKDKGKYQRTETKTPDPYVNPFAINLRTSDNWSGYDYVNGSEKNTQPVISSSCPENHVIDFNVKYWLPINREDHSREIIRNKVSVRVYGEDKTPPVLLWAYVSGDNTIQARIYDGSPIEKVTAHFIPVHNVKGLDYVNLKDPKRNLKIVLGDNGENGDKISGDFIFSKKIPQSAPYFYLVEFESIDSFGNMSIEKCPEVFIVY